MANDAGASGSIDALSGGIGNTWASPRSRGDGLTFTRLRDGLFVRSAPIAFDDVARLPDRVDAVEASGDARTFARDDGGLE